jgi:hypothetical protein
VVAQPLNSLPEDNWDQHQPLDPANGNGNGDEPDDDEDEDGLLRGPPDHNDPEAMQRAQDARERARLQRDQRGNTAYMNPPNLWTTANLSVPNNGRLDPARNDVVERERVRTVLR